MTIVAEHYDFALLLNIHLHSSGDAVIICPTIVLLTISYTIGPETSRICLSHNIPLPVKAEVYNTQNELQYKYSLLT